MSEAYTRALKRELRETLLQCSRETPHSPRWWALVAHRCRLLRHLADVDVLTRILLDPCCRDPRGVIGNVWCA